MKTVSVEELVANIEEHLEAAKRGETLMVTKNGEHIANMVPYAGEESWFADHDPSLRLQDFVPSPRPKNLKSDAVEMLIEDRESEWKKHGL